MAVHKTIIKVVVLHNPDDGLDINKMSLESIANEAMEGDFSADFSIEKSKELTLPQVIEECKKQGTDPEFFGLPNSLTEDEVNEFLSDFGIKVAPNEDDAYVELMMDNHTCVKYKNSQYYIHKCNSLYDNRQQEIADFLDEAYHV